MKTLSIVPAAHSLLNGFGGFHLPSTFDMIDDVLNRWQPHSTNLMYNDFGALNVVESDTGYEVELSVPGLTKDDVQVEFGDGVLVLRGERKVKNNGKYLVNEFASSKFERSFSFTNQINMEDITATHENGVLRISLPKVTQTKAFKKIAVK